MARACVFLWILLASSSSPSSAVSLKRNEHGMSWEISLKLSLCHLCGPVTYLLSESVAKDSSRSLATKENAEGTDVDTEDNANKHRNNTKQMCYDPSLTWPFLSNPQCAVHNWCSEVTNRVRKVQTLQTYTVPQPCMDSGCQDSHYAHTTSIVLHLNLGYNASFCNANVKSCRKSCGCCEFPGPGFWCDDTFEEAHRDGIPDDLTKTDLFVAMTDSYRSKLTSCLGRDVGTVGHCGVRCKSCNIDVVNSWYYNLTDDWKNNAGCVAVTRPCSRYTCGQLLIKQSANQDGEFTVVNTESNDTEAWSYGICPRESVKMMPNSDCVHYQMATGVGIMVSFMIVGFCCCECCCVVFAFASLWRTDQGGNSSFVFIAIALYWTNKFFVGLFVSSLVENAFRGSTLRQRDQDFQAFVSESASKSVGGISASQIPAPYELILAQILTYVLLHGILSFVFCCQGGCSVTETGSSSRWVDLIMYQLIFCIPLGAWCGAKAIYQAYAPLWVAIYGHRVIRLALWNLALDFLRTVVINCVLGAYCNKHHIFVLSELISVFPQPNGSLLPQHMLPKVILKSCYNKEVLGPDWLTSDKAMREILAEGFNDDSWKKAAEDPAE